MPMGEIVTGGHTETLFHNDGSVAGCLLVERMMGGDRKTRTTPVCLYSVAGQTIFQIVGADGGPMNSFESYPDVKIAEGSSFNRAFAVKRTKEEFETEQVQLRKG